MYILLNNQVYSDRETENVPIPIFNTTGYPPSFALSLVGDKLYFGSLQGTQVIIETDKDLSPANNSHLVVSTINDLYARDCDKVFVATQNSVQYLNTSTGSLVLVTEIADALSIIATEDKVFFTVNNYLYQSDYLGTNVERVQISSDIGAKLFVAYSEVNQNIYVSERSLGTVYSYDTQSPFETISFSSFLTSLSSPTHLFAGDYGSLVVVFSGNKFQRYELQSGSAFPGGFGQMPTAGEISDITGLNDQNCTNSGGSGGSGSTDGGGDTGSGGGSGDTGDSGGSTDGGGSNGGGGSSGGTNDPCASCPDGDGDNYPTCCNAECQNIPGEAHVCESEPCDSNALKNNLDEESGLCGGCSSKELPEVVDGNLVCGMASDPDGDGTTNDRCPTDPFDAPICGCSPIPESALANFLRQYGSSPFDPSYSAQTTCSKDIAYVGPETVLPAPIVFFSTGTSTTLTMLVKYIFGPREVQYSRDVATAPASRRKRKQAIRTVANIFVKEVNLKKGTTKIKRIKDKSKELREKTLKVKADPDVVYLVSYKVGLEKKKVRKNGGRSTWRPSKTQQTGDSRTTTAKPPSSLVTR